MERLLFYMIGDLKSCKLQRCASLMEVFISAFCYLHKYEMMMHVLRCIYKCFCTGFTTLAAKSEEAWILGRDAFRTAKVES